MPEPGDAAPGMAEPEAPAAGALDGSLVDAVRAVCLELPEVHEEQAWTGTRWRVRSRTFAHVLRVDEGWPPAYARAVGAPGPMTVLMLRSSGPELAALRAAGAPFFAPPWRHDEIGLILDAPLDATVDTDADMDAVELAELITDSYCVMAPARLVDLVDRPSS